MSPFPPSGVSSPQVCAGQSAAAEICAALCQRWLHFVTTEHFTTNYQHPADCFFPPVFSVLTLHQKRQWWGVVRIERKKRKGEWEMGRVIAAVKEAFEISPRSFAAAATAARAILLESGWNRSCLWKRHKSISGSYDEPRRTKQKRGGIKGKKERAGRERKGARDMG